jgi:hypothetical protein
VSPDSLQASNVCRTGCTVLSPLIRPFWADWKLVFSRWSNSVLPLTGDRWLLSKMASGFCDVKVHSRSNWCHSRRNCIDMAVSPQLTAVCINAACFHTRAAQQRLRAYRLVHPTSWIDHIHVPVAVYLTMTFALVLNVLVMLRDQVVQLHFSYGHWNIKWQRNEIGARLQYVWML